MSLYGVCPARNHLSLVICECCRQSVTPQGLQQHYGMLKQSKLALVIRRVNTHSVSTDIYNNDSSNISSSSYGNNNNTSIVD